jgi:hypothetical protein
MYQNFSINGGIELSQSMLLSLKDYFMSFASNEKKISDADSWGWFVDIDINNGPSKNGNCLLDKKYSKIFSKDLTVLSTINELPSIRSLKSMKNLQDMTFKYEMEELYGANPYNNDTNIEYNNDTNIEYNNDTNIEYNNDINKNNKTDIFNTICVIGVVGLYYLIIAL